MATPSPSVSVAVCAANPLRSTAPHQSRTNWASAAVNSDDDRPRRKAEEEALPPGRGVP